MRSRTMQDKLDNALLYTRTPSYWIFHLLIPLAAGSGVGMALVATGHLLGGSLVLSTLTYYLTLLGACRLWSEPELCNDRDAYEDMGNIVELLDMGPGRIALRYEQNRVLAWLVYLTELPTHILWLLLNWPGHYRWLYWMIQARHDYIGLREAMKDLATCPVKTREGEQLLLEIRTVLRRPWTYADGSCTRIHAVDQAIAAVRTAHGLPSKKRGQASVPQKVT